MKCVQSAYFVYKSAIRTHSKSAFHPERNLELYDLSQDIGEQDDLAARHPDKVRELAAELDRWIELHDVQLSIVKETGQPVEMPSRAAARQIAAATRKQ